MKKVLKYLVLILLLIPTFVLADTGPKPTINIKLKNIDTKDYIIDLMSDFTNRPDDIDKIQGEDYREHPIYKYHEGNWYATALRDFLLFGNVQGNSEHEHTFTYFGVPDEFKVIIELPDGTLKVSDKIIRTAFNFYIDVDVTNMKVTNTTVTSKIGIDANFRYVIILLLTIIVEVLIALLFRTKKYHIIALTNLGTNICLQALMIVLNLNLLYFVLCELGVLVVEGFIYLKTLKINKTKIIIYTIIANLITALLTFII